MSKEGIPGAVVRDPDFGKRLTSREPDALLDEKLFGHQVVWSLWGSREMPFRKGWQDFGMPFSVPYYSSDMREAWKVVEELRKRGIMISVKSREDLDPAKNNCDDLIQLKDMKYAVQSWDKDLNRYSPSVYGKTAEEAICNAALKLLGIPAGADENTGS